MLHYRNYIFAISKYGPKTLSPGEEGVVKVALVQTGARCKAQNLVLAEHIVSTREAIFAVKLDHIFKSLL